MKWHDLLYFSKGERRALTLLTSLIAAAWLTLLWMPPAPDEPVDTRTANSAGNDPVYRPKPAATGTGQRATPPYPNASSKRAGTDVSRSGGQKAGRPSSTSSQAAAPDAAPLPTSSRFPRTSHFPPARTKFPKGTVVELNTADTTILKKVPGIGSSFARRIVKYRNLLGGFYTVAQLGEVYGIDEDRYYALAPWFRTDASLVRPIRINRIPSDSLPYHPYLNKSQKRVLRQLRRQKGRIGGWENLQLLEEFTPADRERLAPYLSFE